MATSKKAGEVFSNRLKALKMRPADFARKMDEVPQSINNWKRRGVPTGKANQAAELLGCEAHEISRVDRAKLRTGLNPMQKLVLVAVDGLSEVNLLAVIQLAVELKRRQGGPA